jgi:alcohol dehydrogenase (cytochrome c)
MKIGSRLKGRRGLAIGAMLLATMLVTTSLAVITVPRLRWRAHVVLLHVTGQIPDIELKEMLAYMMPGSDQWMEPLIERRNPYAVIHNFRTTPTDIVAGAQLFRSRCAGCHAPDGSGGPGGPPLSGRKYKNGESDWAVYRTIRLGIPKTTMAGHALPDTELWQLVAYLRSIDKSGNAVKVENPAATAAAGVNVPYKELVAIREPSEDWLTYSGSYSSVRHTVLNQIDRSNVDRLAVRWIHQFKGESGDLQTTPLVRNGVMFVTVESRRVLALNASDGKQIWSYEHKLSKDTRGTEFGTMQNRGVAILNNKVFFGTADARLIALSAATGAVQWETKVSDDLERYYITSAPLAYRDLVVTGVGTRVGGRGFVVAYDANTGKERWRFIAIPGPGEFGNDTWAGDSWREGGAPTWLTGSYDPELDLLIWGAGNPKPDYDTAARKGDNLYSNSVVALQGSTGKLVWHFQFTPADERDWDSNQIPVLADFKSAKGVEKRVLWANRNGFYYVLDRVSGKYLNATPYVQQTWTDGLDPAGRPKPLSNASRNREGFLLYPGNVGGTNWWSPSFDPALSLFFVQVLEQGMVYFTSFASPPKASGRSFYTAVRALNASTGAMVWEYRREPRLTDNIMGGLLSTKTGLVFGGDLGTFFALDSSTGKPLWSIETGGRIMAAPISYSLDGEQFVAIVAGRSLLAVSLPKRQQAGPPGTLRAQVSSPRLTAARPTRGVTERQGNGSAQR